MSLQGKVAVVIADSDWEAGEEMAAYLSTSFLAVKFRLISSSLNVCELVSSKMSNLSTFFMALNPAVVRKSVRKS